VALTHQLDRRGTPVREFFEQHFPAKQFKPLSAAWYEQVRAAAVVCPSPQGVNLGTIGTAFDYRARLSWAPLIWRQTVAALGREQLIAMGRVEIGLVADEVGTEVERLSMGQAALDPSEEVRLCRACYALALYEQFFRTFAAARSSPLIELADDASLEDVLALAPDAAVDDLASMARLLRTRMPDLICAPGTLNPTFDGSHAIGGADADLIVDGLLVELKTTSQDSFERVDHVYQLLGYALLDYTNTYGINRVGVYLARRGVLVSWEIDELLETCCTTQDWTELQREFRTAVDAVAAGLLA
jgi:hypothetical protein